MRCCACGWAADTLDEVLELAKQSAECTHNHPEGIKGAQATAAVIFMARNGKTKGEIRDYVHEHYYDMSKSYEDYYNEDYSFHKTCQETVPRAIVSFLYSEDFESAIRMSMLLDKDTDTIGAIVGSMAEAFYGVPECIKKIVRETLNEHLLDVLDEFEDTCRI